MYGGQKLLLIVVMLIGIYLFTSFQTCFIGSGVCGCLMCEARRTMARLATSLGCSDVTELCERHAVDVLTSMNDTYQTWTQHSTERLVFEALLMEAGRRLTLL